MARGKGVLNPYLCMGVPLALMSSPENDVMLTDDLLNKYR